MKTIIIILLPAVLFFCGCTPRPYIIKEIYGPEHSMGVWVVPYMPYPPLVPLPSPNPLPDSLSYPADYELDLRGII